MPSESKYYYITPVYKGYTSTRHPLVVKWNENYYVEVVEDVEYIQYLSLEICKFSKDVMSKPKCDESEKVRPILKEIFFDHYYFALKKIDQFDVTEGEYYLIKHSKEWHEIKYFSNLKRTISIDIRDSIDYLRLTLHSIQSLTHRPGTRKNGSPMSLEKFKQFLNLTLKFLYDTDSYNILQESYLKNFYSLIDNKEMEYFVLGTEKSYTNILEQLESRKKILEKRLIEIDNDTEVDRVRFRGEIDGINYAISTIKMNQ